MDIHATSRAAYSVLLTESLFSCHNIIACIGNNTFNMYNTHFLQKNSEICTYSYPDIILAVKLNRQRLVVVLKQNLYIHNIRDMKVHWHI